MHGIIHHMEHEKSCGAVIFDSRKKDAFVLLIQQIDGHWGFPKGHIEKDETEQESARREIKEETGLEVQFDKNFHTKTTYNIHEKCEKEVVYFLGYETGGKEKMQKDEISHMVWCKPIQALGCITYENDAEILKDVMKYRKLKW